MQDAQMTSFEFFEILNSIVLHLISTLFNILFAKI